MADNRIRLQKFLSEAGVASRRKGEEMIQAGQVCVNGRKAQIGDTVDPAHDTVTVKGKKVQREQVMRYVLLHKPRGFVTTMDDELGRKCVTELVSDIPERIYPVGRLDRASEGALLMTNDGAFANAMMHPSKHISKTYRVTVRPSVSEEQLIKLQTGIEIDGRMTAPADAFIISKEEGRVVLEIVLHEGRNREIRKMCEALGLEVARLKRTAIGTLKLGMLPQGEWRDLTEQELDRLFTAAGMKKDKKGKGK